MIEAGVPFIMEWASSYNTSKNEAVPCASVFPHYIRVYTKGEKKNANRKKSKQKPHQKSWVLLKATMALHSRGVHRNTNLVCCRLHVWSHDLEFNFILPLTLHFDARLLLERKEPKFFSTFCECPFLSSSQTTWARDSADMSSYCEIGIQNDVFVKLSYDKRRLIIACYKSCFG